MRRTAIIDRHARPTVVVDSFFHRLFTESKQTPFPATEIGEYARRYPNLKEIVWVQEEPRNMGARKFVMPKIREILPSGVTLLDVSRPERSSPAEGYPAAHKIEQERIVAAAYGS